MKNRRLIIILISVVVLLLIPLFAMQFTEEVSWTVLDFVIMGVLLLVTGLLCDLVLRKLSKSKYRVLIVIGILMAFLLIWAELAVGIFGTPFSGS